MGRLILIFILLVNEHIETINYGFVLMSNKI